MVLKNAIYDNVLRHYKRYKFAKLLCQNMPHFFFFDKK